MRPHHVRSWEWTGASSNEIGLQRAPDQEVFPKAFSDNRILLTFDLDFGEIAAFARERRAGIVLFRLHNTRTAHVVERLSRAPDTYSEALKKGNIVVVEEGRYRIRELPVAL